MRLTLIVLGCLSPVFAGAGLEATFGPRGEVTELRLGGVVYFTDAAVSLTKPGWTGTIVDQRAAPPASVTVSHPAGATVYQATLVGEGARVALREVARVTPDRVSLEYEITPEADLPTEAVVMEATMPCAVHAGVTRYVVGDAAVTRGTCPAAPNPTTHVLFGAVAEWLGLIGPGGTALRVTPTGAPLQFQDNRRFNSPYFMLLVQGGGGKLAAGKTIRFAVAFAADTAERIEADAADLGPGPLTAFRQRDDRPLGINAVRASAGRVETFSPLELRADVAATYSNPFDPDQIAVEASVTGPAGASVTVPGFYYAPMKLETRLGVERLRLNGEPDFRVRYTPTAPGRYRIVLRATGRTGSVTSAPVWFDAAAARAPGFVRVAKASPRYFAFDSGESYFAVGENMAWANNNTAVASYAAWLKGLGNAGGNWARLFLSNLEKGQEWMPLPTERPGVGAYLGLGRYAQDNAWRLDEVLRLAGRSGVRLMFCLGTSGELYMGGYFNEGCWVSNPYNAKNGGPCQRAEDFWTSEQARKLYKQRLRYLIARWGYSPDLFAWELWNEIPPTPQVEAWGAEMAAYLKHWDPNRHLVSTTYGSPAMARCPDVDFTMQHLYGQAGGTADFTPVVAGAAADCLAWGKPYFPAEFGIDWQTGDERWDPAGTGLNMHNGLWASTMTGAAGTTMLWYWDGYVHPKNLYHVLTPLRKFADTVDWAHTRFTPVAGLKARVPGGTAETFSDVTIPASSEWGKTGSAEYTVGRDGVVQGGPVARTLGSPTRIPGQLFTQVVWHLDMPHAGKVRVRLGDVAARARLQVRVDGVLKVDRPLATGGLGQGPWKTTTYLPQYQIWVSNYDEEIPVDVPAGRHDLTLANAEGDWLQIPALTLPGYRSSLYPDLNLLGLQSDRLLLLWVHNRESTWRTEYDGKRPGELHGMRLSVPVVGVGAWRVEWWDTFRGEVTRREVVPTTGGELPLIVPDFSRDLAAKVERTG